MSRGKYLNLDEARKSGKLDRFCKEHPSEADEERFRQLFDAMVNPAKSEPKNSAKDEKT